MFQSNNSIPIFQHLVCFLDETDQTFVIHNITIFMANCPVDVSGRRIILSSNTNYSGNVFNSDIFSASWRIFWELTYD